MPEHLLILPCTHEAIERLLAGNDEPPATAIEAACFMFAVLTAAGKIDNPKGTGMRFLDEARHLLQDSRQRTEAIEQAREMSEFNNVAATLLKRCRSAGVGFVSDEELGGVRALLVDGSPAPDLAEQLSARKSFSVHTGRAVLTGPRDQIVALTVLREDFREFSRVEAFAGTGKTHLVRTLLQANPPEGSVYLTKTGTQALGLAGPDSLGVKKLNWSILLSTSLRRFVYASSFRSLKLPPFGLLHTHPGLRSKLAAEFGVPMDLIDHAYSALCRWAGSHDDQLGTQHVHWRATSKGLSTDPNTNDIQIAHVAREIWSRQAGVLLGRQATIPFTTSLYARLFNEHEVPLAVSGTIFVDEAHDLPNSLARVIEHHQGGAICLGDGYQSFRQRPPIWTRGRQLTMTEAVRFGGAATDLVNSAVNLLDKSSMGPRLEANPTLNTRVRLLKGEEGRSVEGLHVYGSPAMLLKHAKEFTDRGKRVFIVGDSRWRCKQWAAELVDALTVHDEDRTSYSGKANTDAATEDLHRLAAALGTPELVGWAERSLTHRVATDLLAASTDANCAVWLALAETSRNLEKDTVVLHHCCFVRPRNEEHIKHFYVAASRARHQLWLPPNAWR